MQCSGQLVGEKTLHLLGYFILSHPVGGQAQIVVLTITEWPGTEKFHGWCDDWLLMLCGLCVVKVVENKAVVKTYSPDFFHFSISGLEQLLTVYGSASAQYTDALTLLNTVSQHVSSAPVRLLSGYPILW